MQPSGTGRVAMGCIRHTGERFMHGGRRWMRTRVCIHSRVMLTGRAAMSAPLGGTGSAILTALSGRAVQDVQPSDNGRE